MRSEFFFGLQKVLWTYVLYVFLNMYAAVSMPCCWTWSWMMQWWELMSNVSINYVSIHASVKHQHRYTQLRMAKWPWIWKWAMRFAHCALKPKHHTWEFMSLRTFIIEQTVIQTCLPRNASDNSRIWSPQNSGLNHETMMNVQKKTKTHKPAGQPRNRNTP